MLFSPCLRGESDSRGRLVLHIGPELDRVQSSRNRFTVQRCVKLGGLIQVRVPLARPDLEMAEKKPENDNQKMREKDDLPAHDVLLSNFMKTSCEPELTA